MDDFGDRLSGPSFAFLFPVLRSALSGPRTAPGTEAALSLLHRHAPLLSGEGAVSDVVRPLRREMAAAVLELLAHDRSQTFTDPTPTEALVACYAADGSGPSAGPGPGASDLSPLLDERGALGGRNCRAAAMDALAAVASDRPRLVRSNPLIENRIWLNCFEGGGARAGHVRDAMRRAWRIANGAEEEEDEDNHCGGGALPLPLPFKLYAVPLLPLLNHKDKSIATAAADAFTHAIGMHPNTVEKNINRLCSVYIESFPTSFDEDGGAAAPAAKSATAAVVAKPSIAPPPKKKAAKISTGLPKKTKKTSVGGTSLGKLTGMAPKRRTGKSLAKLAPKPKERSFDKELLESQFATGGAKKADAEKDSEAKIGTRLGVLGAVAPLTDAEANFRLELPVLKVLIAFLVAYGHNL